LLTPSPTEAELAAALASEADFVILDPAGMPPAPARDQPFVKPRLVAKLGDAIEDDLNNVMPWAPWAILASCRSGADVQRLGAKLAVREARFGLVDGATRIVASVGDAQSVMNLPSFVGASLRLAALAFFASARPNALARGLVALAAAAAEIAAIDGPTFSGDFQQEAESARDQGFSGKIAANAEQVAILNSVFVGL
jgi:citrate lyase subunit beta/citryl-CoA lyase